MNTAPAPRSGRGGFVAWLKAHAAPVTGLVIALGIMGAVLWVYLNNPGVLKELRAYGYLGAFIVSVFLNGTILLPVSNMAIIVSLGATLPVPLFVGLAGGSGAAIGELTGYLLGRSGRSLVSRSRMYTRVEGWVRRWGWVAVFFLSAFPFAFDVVGIIAGALRMPLWRFLLACWAGRTVSYTTVAYAGSIWLKEIPWWAYAATFLALVVGALLINAWRGKDGTA